LKQSVSPILQYLPTINLVAFWTIFGLTFVFIVAKAFMLPITHDEVATALYYPQLSNTDLLTLANGDQNNHILNTLSSKLFISIFGNHLWALRLPSVLSFIIYAFGARSILKQLIGIQSRFFAIGALLFVLSPYVIDFFCLSRGYGMCVAFTTASVASLLQYVKLNSKAEKVNVRVRHLFFALFFAALACLSGFSSISFLCAVITIVFDFLIVQKVKRCRNLLFFVAMIVSIFSLMYLPLLRISEADQFVGWHNNGFIQDTVMSLVRLSLYGSKIFFTTAFLTYFFLTVIAIGGIYSFVQSSTSNRIKSLGENLPFVAISVLLLTVLINLLQGWVLHLPNLNGRIALFFYPLIVIALLACKPMFSFLHSKIKWLVILFISFFGIHHVLHISKLNEVLEWKYDAHTLMVLNTIKATTKGKKVILESSWLYQPSLSYHGMEKIYAGIAIGNYSKEINSNSLADFYYCKEEDYKLLSNNFNVLIKFDDNWLLKHK